MHCLSQNSSGGMKIHYTFNFLEAMCPNESLFHKFVLERNPYDSRLFLALKSELFVSELHMSPTPLKVEILTDVMIQGLCVMSRT